MKSLDKAILKIDKYLLEKAAKEKKMKPILDKCVKEIQSTDKSINWYEEKIKELKEKKQKQLRKFADLIELTDQQKHSLDNGYTVMPDNSYKHKIKDINAFLNYLKKNKTPTEVMDFLTSALKVTEIKSFCDKEVNLQRLNGEILPAIAGIEIGDLTYTNYKTLIKADKRRNK